MRRAPPSPRPAARGILCVACLRFASLCFAVYACRCRPASGAAPESAPRCVLSAHPPRRRPPASLLPHAACRFGEPGQSRRASPLAAKATLRACSAWGLEMGAWGSVCSGAGALAGPEGEKRRQAVEFVRRPFFK